MALRDDGRTVTFAADGAWRDATVHGRTARARFTGLSGAVDVTLLTPSGCEVRGQVECD